LHSSCGTATHAQQGIDDLAKHFRLKDQGEMTVFIGQVVIRNESGILLRQARYARALTERFGMWDCAPGWAVLDVTGCAFAPSTAGRKHLIAPDYFYYVRQNHAYPSLSAFSSQHQTQHLLASRQQRMIQEQLFVQVPT
jgi:hypothetical protein